MKLIPIKPSFRVWFLIVAAYLVFHLSFWVFLVILIGYGIAEDFDQWLAKRSREGTFDDEMFGWEQSKGEPEMEEKGDSIRVRLTGQNQILAVRIGELFMRMR